MAEVDVTARPSRNLSAWSVTWALLSAQIGQLATARKTWALLAIQGVMIVVAGVALATDEYLDGLTLFRNVIEGAIFPFVIPMVALFFGGPTIVDEMEGRTLTYLTLRPIPKPMLYLGKLAGAVLVGSVVLMVPTLLLYVVCVFGGGDPGATAGLISRMLAACALGVATYSVIFAALGALFARSMLAGIIYFVLFEVVFANLPILEFASVRMHLRIVAGMAKEESDNMLLKMLFQDAQDPPMWIGLLVCMAAFTFFTLFGAFVFRSRQYDV